MRILVLLSRFPFPLEKGDKLRAYHQIKSLSEHHEVLLFAVNDHPVTEAHLCRITSFLQRDLCASNPKNGDCLESDEGFFQ